MTILSNQNQKENMVVFVINAVQYLFLKGLKLVFQDVLIQALVNVQLDVDMLYVMPEPKDKPITIKFEE